MSPRVYVGLTVVLAFAGGTLFWWLLTSTTTEPPERQSIAGLKDTASIAWTTEHTATLNVSNETDALAALGYVHGRTRAWTLTIWRRTASGRLSATFGDGLISTDRHVRKLGFAHHARRAYEQLPPKDQRLLQAYVRGLNAALLSERVRSRDPFVYLNLTPQRWKPWHPVAIERLLAWTGTNLPSSVDTAGNSPSEFLSADRVLRHWLHLHGRTRSVAWATRSDDDTTHPALFARHVLGAMAEPIVQEVVLHRSDSSSAAMASLPGTLLFPTGTTGSRKWTYMLGSPARIEPSEVDTTQIRTRHERIVPADGDEELATVRHCGEGLVIDSVAADSAWVLRWPGLQAQTDIPSWIDTATLRAPSSSSDEEAASFHLFRGAGLSLDSTGNWAVQGEPNVVERGPETILVGNSPWAQHQSDGLQGLAKVSPVDPERWSARDSSTWAAGLLPRLVPDLSPLEGTDSTYDDALSYLRNWNFVYEPASIGAVLFEEWMRAYRAEIGGTAAPSDSTYLAAPRRRQSFRRAVERLIDRYGADVRQWRWERVASNRLHFPVWSADSLVAADLSSLSTTRYASLARPGRGHVSALAGGPSLVDPLSLGPAPTRWEGWMQSKHPHLSVRRLRFDPSAFFAHSFLPRQRPPSVSVTEAPVTETTQLVPSQPEEE